jgi:demethylmenaquinone methyltransferase/2-methoxy-6-polyprenyl-1,4-benzoquinol methylase
MTEPSHHEANRAFYDRISAAYDLIADANERPAREEGVRLLALKEGEKVLEVGFGTGNEVLALAGLVGVGGLVAGIDVSPGMLAVTRRKLEGKPAGAPLDLRVGDARQLPWPDSSFDAAYSSFTLELFPEEDIPVALAEVKRVLRPGGRVAVVSMARVKPGEKPSLLERGYVWMHRHFPHLVDCRPIDAAGALEAAGLHVVRQSNLAIWTMPVAAVVAERG